MFIPNYSPEVEALAQELVDTGAYTWEQAYSIAGSQVHEATVEEAVVLDEELDEQAA